MKKKIEINFRVLKSVSFLVGSLQDLKINQVEVSLVGILLEHRCKYKKYIYMNTITNI